MTSHLHQLSTTKLKELCMEYEPQLVTPAMLVSLSQKITNFQWIKTDKASIDALLLAKQSFD